MNFQPVAHVYRNQIWQNLKLFQSYKARVDYIGRQVLANKELITDGSFPLRYHRNCRATYQSLYHQSFASSLKRTDFDMNNNESVTIIRRSSLVAFNWKSQCFICGERWACVTFIADLYSISRISTLNAIRSSKALTSQAPKFLLPTEHSF